MRLNPTCWDWYLEAYQYFVNIASVVGAICSDTVSFTGTYLAFGFVMDHFWKLRFGKICEQKAMQYLKKKGYWIKHKNYRTKVGEIDLIATSKDQIVFVEVKALVHSDYFSPQDHFDWKKQRKQLLLGKQYMGRISDEFYARFDLITVVKKDEDYFIEHFENVIDDSL